MNCIFFSEEERLIKICEWENKISLIFRLIGRRLIKVRVNLGVYSVRIVIIRK